MRCVLAGAVALALAACATFSPSAVAGDAALIASGLSAALSQVAGMPATVPAELSDLSSAATAIAGADTPAAAQADVTRIETDLNAVVGALAAIPLPSAAAEAVQAAEVLLPVIEAAVGLTPLASSAPGGMTPGAARLVLAGAAAK